MGTPTHVDSTQLLGYVCTFRLTPEGLEVLRCVIEASCYSGGVIAAFVIEGC